MTANEFKDLYNELFFNGKQAKEVTATLILVDGEEEYLRIPGAVLRSGSTIDSIAKEHHQLLKIVDARALEEVVAEPEEEEEDQEPALLHFKLVTVGRSTYLVEEREGGIFHIQRQDNQKIIGMNTPHGRRILKVYRNPEKEEDVRPVDYDMLV